MRQNNSNKTGAAEINTQQLQPPASKPYRGPGLKNLAAFHELMRREGYCVPALSSKFVNKITLNQMYTGKIFCLRQEDIVYRECVKPPSKLVMVQKLEKYLRDINRVSGIDMGSKNFPDKAWLLLAVASLSEGSDEIFHPEYMSNRSLLQAVED